MAYITQDDLENALSVHVVKAVFDDDLSGEANAQAVDACLEYASAECDSFLEGVYDDVSFPLADPPVIVKYAAIDFACAYCARRRPDLVKAMGEEPWQRFQDHAIAKMERFVKSKQRLPAATGTPANVGAEVRSGDAEFPTVPTPARNWQRMGDF